MSFSKKLPSFFVILLLVVLAIPSVYSLFHSGFFQSDDGEWMIIRFASFHQALRDGQFPVRFLGTLNHGYGYPVANFLYPGFMYLAEPIHVIGVGFVNAIKVILGISLIGSLVFTFLWLSKLFKRCEAVIGSLVYLYAPYHMYDIYKRGSIGEMLALGIVPFVFWQIERESFFWATIGIALLVLSHNTLALLFLPVIILYSCLRKKKILFSFLSGLCISGFFLIPALYDLQYTVFSQTQVSEWQKYFADSNLIGLITLVILIAALNFMFVFKKKLLKDRLFIWVFIIGFVTVFLASSFSIYLWNILPVSFIQFPFRFLSVSIFCSSFLCAYLLSHSSKKYKTILGALFLLILVISTYSFISPAQFFDKGEGFYSTNQDTTTVKNEYMPTWVKKVPETRWEKKIEFNNGVISQELIKSNRINFSIFSPEGGEVKINTIYFPGWIAKVDGKKISIDYKNNSGIITFLSSPGNHDVSVLLTETPVRAISNIISLVSFLGVIYVSVKKKKLLIK